MINVNIVCGLVVDVIPVLSVWSTNATARTLLLVQCDWKSTHHVAPIYAVDVRVVVRIAQ